MDALIDEIGTVIKFSETRDFPAIANGFNASAVRQFPNIVGCIDGTHLKVEIKHNHEKHCYKNYKKFHSIHLLAVCRENLMFTYIFAGWPGNLVNENFSY